MDSGFLNPERGRGESKYFDAQAHLYPKKLVIDVFLQFYKGYHLLPEGLGAAIGESYFTRPDMRVRKIGASAQYLLWYHGKFFLPCGFPPKRMAKKIRWNLPSGL